MDEMRRRQLLDKDRKYLWHPFTQMKDYETTDHLLIEKAEGIHLYDAAGNRYFDTVSSWWTNVHGHGHPRLREAIEAQMKQVDHVMFSGLTHEPGILLAEQLVKLAPPGLSRVFYSDNGSTAVEVALKMSFQYWQHRGQTEKTKFIYLAESYHGDTLGAVGVGGVDLFHSMFRPLLMSAYKAASPAIDEQRSLQEIRQLLEQHGQKIAAVIVEPLVQAAGGMLLYAPSFLVELRRLCDHYAVHLIADEVATGFGRTGRMFACEHAGITPDFMCLSKGITGGVMPLSATLCTTDIYEAFYDDYETMKTFFHGHSYTGNPLACAVALASLGIFEEEAVLERVARTSAHLQQRVRSFAELPHVDHVRGIGMIAAFDLLADKDAGSRFPASMRMGYRAYREGLKEGLILRPLGDTLYYWLPLCTTGEQIDEIIERTMRVLQRLPL